MTFYTGLVSTTWFVSDEFLGGGDYGDYPEINLRRQQVVNRCHLQNADENIEYSEYEDYSEVSLRIQGNDQHVVNWHLSPVNQK